MRALGGTAVAMAMLALAAAPAAAQDGCAGLAEATGNSGRAPALFVDATAEIRELRFASSPRADVWTRGCAGLDSVIVTERVNLPDPVEPGVTYRDVRVGIEVRAHLDVVCHPALAAAPELAAVCGSASPDPQQPPPDAPVPANPFRR